MNTLALDIGGANIKSVHSTGVAQCKPFALWRQPDQLIVQLRDLAEQIPPFDRLAVTMTAELCDCFATKKQGVAHVLDATEALAGGRPVGVWLTEGRFGDLDAARADPAGCAAANWHALATFVAQCFPQGMSLLIDCGSTTTDLIVLDSGRVAAQGHTDTERLATGELVYLGASRTPLMALARQIRWEGSTYRLMAECFATTADVYLLTGDLPIQPDRTDTADGRPQTIQCAAARLARMIGADLDGLNIDDARELARVFAQIVRDHLIEAMGQVLAGRRPDRVIIGGSGEFVAADAARAGLSDVAQESLAVRFGLAFSEAACAYALVGLSEGIA